MKKFLTPVLAASVLCFATPDVFAQYQLTTLGSAVVENFAGFQAPIAASPGSINFTTSLNTAGGDTTAAQRISAWTLSTGNGTRGNANFGSNVSGGGIYNVNAAGDQALGFLATNSNDSVRNLNAVAAFRNASGSTVTSILVGYTGGQFQEQTGNRNNFIEVRYSTTSAAAALTGTLISGYNFNQIANSATASRNIATSVNNDVFTGANLAMSLSAGETLYLAFRYYSTGSGGSGASQGLAIDDISVTFQGGGTIFGNYWAPDSGGGGTGTWTSAGTNWATGSGGSGSGATQGGGTLIFGNTSGTVTVDGGVTASAGMQFSTTGYTIQSSTIALGGASAAANIITTDTGVTATISSQLTGSAGMTKAGSGTLVLGGANSFTGTTTVSTGTLALDSGASLASSVALGAGTTLDLTAKTSGYSLASGTTLSGSGTVTTASDQTLRVGTGATIAPGTASASGNLTLGGLAFEGGGAYAVTMSNVSGAAGVAWDLLTVLNEFDITATSGSKFNISIGGNTANPVGFYNTGNYSWDIATLGTGSITGFSAEAFNLVNNFTGSDGTLSLTSDGSKLTLSYLAGTPQAELFSSPSSSQWLSAANWTDGVIPGPGDTARIGANPTAGVLGINMNTAGGNYSVGAIEITEDRTNTVSISNSSTGTAGVLTLQGATVNGTTNVILRNNSSGTLTVANGASQTMGVVLGNTTNNVVVIDSSGGITISSAISGTGNGLTLTGAGSGVLTLSGANTYTGPTSVINGRLNISGSVSSDVTISAGATLAGLGAITGDLSFESGANFAFNLAGPLIVNTGTVSFGGFSLNNVVGLTSAVDIGRYTLIGGTATFNFDNVSDFGVSEKVDIGGGKFAYLDSGSFVVEVIPEPSTYAMLALAGAGFAGYVIRRRRR